LTSTQVQAIIWAMIKVFVSSKQGELDPERAALHQALQSAEWDNFAIEFSGAFPDSVRDVFLQHIGECDVYLGIFAGVYSQPTVDEYHKAKDLGKPILIYLKKCANRDLALDEFIRTELQPSHKYQEFSTTEELVSHLPDIRRALDAEVQKHQRQAYLDALVAQTELLELAGIADTGEQERPKLQEIFVALSAAEEIEERDERQPNDKRERERPITITRRVMINEALLRHRHLIILGDPGSGKSTLLRYVALAFAGNESEKYLQLREQALPILVRLSSFAQSRQSFIEYFATYAEKQLHVSLGKKFFERALEDGQAIVCLDGLDEISQPAQRIDVRNAITALANRYPRNRFIITSRVAGYDSASFDKRAFAHHTIVPFGEKEIQSFVEKWYAAREREPEQVQTHAANLFNDLTANERLLKLAENPLTLTIIALVHQRAQGKLPDARVELYDRCAKTMIDKWDEWKGLEPKDKEQPFYQRRRHWLERAAYWMHIEAKEVDVAQVTKRALEKQVACFIADDEKDLPEDVARNQAEKFVALTTSRTGILVEREQGAVSFIHLTFQEYFAASDLYWRFHKTPDALWRAIQPRLYDSRWLEVILLLLGRLNDDDDIPSIIVEKILREHDKFDDVIHRDLFLAARCLAENVNINEPLQNEVVNALLNLAYIQRPDFGTLQFDAINTLGTLKSNRIAGNRLMAIGNDEKVDPWVRSFAAQALGEFGYKEDAARLPLAVAKNEKVHPWIRNIAAEKLGHLGQIDEAVRLIRMFAEDRAYNSWVQTLAAQALGNLGYTDEAVKLLLGIGQDYQVDADVRCIAVQLLADLGHKNDAFQLLLALVKDENIHIGVRGNAAQALYKLGHSDDAVQLLLTLGRGIKGNTVDSYVVVQKLEQFTNSSDSVQSLLSLAHEPSADVSVRSNAAQALGELGHMDEALQLLLVLIQDESVQAGVRNGVAQALGRFGQGRPTVAIKLLKLSRDERDYIRNSAYDALKKVVGNLRYMGFDNEQKRIKRTNKKIAEPKSKIVNRISKIGNRKSGMDPNESTQS
jgi:HEAT repeat protein/predicted ATPase